MKTNTYRTVFDLSDKYVLNGQHPKIAKKQCNQFILLAFYYML